MNGSNNEDVLVELSAGDSDSKIDLGDMDSDDRDSNDVSGVDTNSGAIFSMGFSFFLCWEKMQTNDTGVLRSLWNI